MMNLYKSDKESGVALVFAIGLLGLMLAVGIAFVGNALLFKQVAKNNSSRTQARMIAHSALSRTMASIMLYQEQLSNGNIDKVKDFGGSYSFDKIKLSSNNSNDETTTNDGLLGGSSHMLLPENDVAVPKNFAVNFNAPFHDKSWGGSWTYFKVKEGSGSDSVDRIIGRAAWQVVSTQASILAPVFFRGAVPGVDEDNSDLSLRDNRWGRDIDEVYVDTVDTLLGALGASDALKLTSKMSSYDDIYGSYLQNLSDDDKLWFERWFIPDSDENANVADPTPTTAETYMENSGGDRRLLRFNISEVFDVTKYKVGSGVDPWYARFGADSTNSSASGNTYEAKNIINGEGVLELLTRDAINYVYDDEENSDDCDYDLELEDRTSLPFLRLIGNQDDENVTFISGYETDANGKVTANLDMSAWRKQIAANFNDYCDADSVPTSDVAAENWLTSTTQPKFTGNEKTPYIYEVAFKLDMVDAPDSENRGVKISGETAENGDVKLTFGKNGIKIAPVMKLANIYNFDPSGVFDSMRGYVDFNKVNMWYRLEKITLKNVTFSYTDANGIRVPKTMEKIELVYGETDEDEMDCFKDVSLRNTDVDSLNDLVLKSEFTFNTESDIPDNERGAAFLADDVNNSSGAKQYPRKTAEKWQTATDANSVLKLCKNDFTTELKDGDTPVNQLTAKLDYETVKKLKQAAGLNLPDTVTDFKLESIGSVFVDKISVLAGAFQLRRMVLTGKKGETSHGVDYVRKFEKPLIFHLSKDNIEDDKLKFEFKDGIATTQGILVGGIRNFDPRQNLNPEDWFPYDSAVAADWHPDPAKAADGEGNLQIVKAANITADDELSQVMDSAANTRPAQNSNGGAVAATLNDIEINDALFTPRNSDSSLDKDLETVTEPAYSSETNCISTAVIRNAPMMSPWEIGFIHRGIAWQTINLKKAGHPKKSGKIDLSNAPFAHGEKWDGSGTAYSAGDAGILEQIRMTEQCATYGKININSLVAANNGNYAAKDVEIFNALFRNVICGENVFTFLRNSTRNGDGKFNISNTGTGTAVINKGSKVASDDTNFTNLYNSGETFACRVQAVERLKNAFGMVTPDSTDAQQEEIIGKTINLLSAESSANVIKVVIVAQSIKDNSGVQIRDTKGEQGSNFSQNTGVDFDDNEKLAINDCQVGVFDMCKHDNDPEKNIYFDDITGEVKMLVSIERVQGTGQLKVRKIEYLE